LQWASKPKTAVTAGLSYPTVIKAIQPREAIGRQRGGLFIYDRYLAILAEGTEPLPRCVPGFSAACVLASVA
jgi:hypothetical protein